LISEFLLSDATCLCTGTGAGPCNPLASGIRSIIDKTNSLFNTAYNASSVALTIWDIQGSPVGKTCATQVELIDIAPGLTPDIDSTRSAWAQSALLWSVVESGDLLAAEDLRSFIAKSNFTSLVQSGRMSIESSPASYQKLSAGYLFDFDKMTITTPDVKWASTNPSEAQQAHVSTLMGGILDKFYTLSTG
jgi:hypothetical protein